MSELDGLEISCKNSNPTPTSLTWVRGLTAGAVSTFVYIVVLAILESGARDRSSCLILLIICAISFLLQIMWWGLCD